MKTSTGLFIKCDEESDLFYITRQSAERGCEKVMDGRVYIYSCACLQCASAHNMFYLDGSDEDRTEHYDYNIPFIGSFFETIIFPTKIKKFSGFNYLKDIVL